jgi:D-alanyl-lipoteichoic acid acyltransferase DltB (MBOAT superfamily)
MHLEMTFWALVAGVGVCLRLAPVRGTAAFGLANLGALVLLLGAEVALTGLVVAVALWALLRIATAGQGWANWLAGRLAYLVPLGVFVAYKAAGDWPPAQAWLGTAGPLPQVHALLVGLSFSYASLRCLDAVRCVTDRRSPLLDPVGLVGYLFPFHMLVAGPVAAYDQHLSLDVPDTNRGWPDRLISAASDISTGLVYKHVVAEYLRAYLFGLDVPLRTTDLADTAALFVYLFFDFAGYSRIALGTGTLMGVPTPVNFRAPFAARNITDFFARWHASLGAMVQRNMYVPLQLRLVRRFGVHRALWVSLATLLVCWLFVGLWHRLSLNFVLYGATFAVVVWIEKTVLDRRWVRPARAGTATAWAQRLLGTAYVFVTVTLMLHMVMNELLSP